MATSPENAAGSEEGKDGFEGTGKYADLGREDEPKTRVADESTAENMAYAGRKSEEKLVGLGQDLKAEVGNSPLASHKGVVMGRLPQPGFEEAHRAVRDEAREANATEEQARTLSEQIQETKEELAKETAYQEKRIAEMQARLDALTK